jgi:hypothetical protein
MPEPSARVAGKRVFTPEDEEEAKAWLRAYRMVTEKRGQPHDLSGILYGRESAKEL